MRSKLNPQSVNKKALWQSIFILALFLILSQADTCVADEEGSGLKTVPVADTQTSTDSSPETGSARDELAKEPGKGDESDIAPGKVAETDSKSEPGTQSDRDDSANAESSSADQNDNSGEQSQPNEFETESYSQDEQEKVEEKLKKKPATSPVLRILEKSTESLIRSRQGTKPTKKLTKEEIKTSLIDMLVESALKVTLIVVLTAVSLTLANILSKRVIKLISKDKQSSELKKRATTLSSVVRYLLIAGILATSTIMLLKELRIDVAPIIAGAGVLTLAAGFGAQSLVKDIISGFFILLEDQIRVGDVISIADKRGTVEKVTLRMVALRDVRGNVHYIPSGEISVVTNMTKDFSRYLFDIGVAYKENTDHVIEQMRLVDADMHADENFAPHISGDLEVMGVHRFENSAVIIRARIKTSPGKQWKVGREYNRRFKLKFDEVGIEIPYPHMTVYPGSGKDGNAPKFTLSMTETEEEKES